MVDKPDADLDLADVLIVDKHELKFPSLSVCGSCRGYHSLYVDGRNVRRPDLAKDVALVLWGRKFGNVHYMNVPYYTSCDCDVTKAKLRKEVTEKLGIESDSKWQHDSKTSHVRRGINDYERTISFYTPPNEEDLDLICEWLKTDDCPGWTGVHARKLSDSKYAFRTTCDSSD